MNIPSLARLIFWISILFTSSACGTTTAKKQETELSLDRQLIISLAEKDINKARDLLERGANPEAILGEEWDDHAVCMALDDRSSKYFELLVEYGADPNAYFDVDYDSRRTPLGCAVLWQNFEGFHYLLSNGADPSIDLCEECYPGDYSSRSALTSSLSSNNFPMAMAILENYKPRPKEIEFILYMVEDQSFDESHPWSDARAELIEWVKSQGIPVTPNPASPAPNGIKKQCVFSFRDLEEGLREGTVCRD